MALARELTNHSLPEIGESFGGRDHTTVLHACRIIKELRDSNSDIHEDYKNPRVYSFNAARFGDATRFKAISVDVSALTSSGVVFPSQCEKWMLFGTVPSTESLGTLSRASE